MTYSSVYICFKFIMLGLNEGWNKKSAYQME